MWKLAIVALLASNAVACGTGCFEYNGSCACDSAPEKSVTPEVVPSDEKPPRSGIPSWQDPTIKASEPQSLIYQDSKSDADKKAADVEGKKAAGIVYMVPDADVGRSTN